MDKELLRKRIERNRRVTFIQNCIKIGVCVVAALIIITVGWKLLGPVIKTTGISEDAQTRQVIEVKAGTNVQADGSGDAAMEPIGETRQITAEVPGWQVDAGGWWYAADNENCFANGWLTIDGSQYHFGSDGYMDTGWTPIGGRGYYFQENGVYDPNRDKSKMIALTFDDGPGPYTNELIDLLEANGAKASFFLQGINVERYGADTIPRMAELGFYIGNHSYDHPNLKKLGVEGSQDQFNRTDDLIAQYNNGQKADGIRFPFGEFTKEEAQATGRACWFWDIDTLDWKTKDVNSNISAVLDHAEGGNIVLMHDIHQATVEACKTIIPELINRGYDLVTVEELAASRGYEAAAGVTYYGFTDTMVNNQHVTDEERSAG